MREAMSTSRKLRVFMNCLSCLPFINRTIRNISYNIVILSLYVYISGLVVWGFCRIAERPTYHLQSATHLKYHFRPSVNLPPLPPVAETAGGVFSETSGTSGGKVARINIEDSIHQDRRFKNLVLKLGEDAAIGALYRAWRLAQDYWVKDQSGIPRAVWEEHGARDEIIEVRLAEEKNGIIRLSGSENQFGWLLAQKENGKKGGQAKSRNYSGNSVATASRRQAVAKPLTPTLSPTLTLTQILNPQETEKSGKGAIISDRQEESDNSGWELEPEKVAEIARSLKKL